MQGKLSNQQLPPAWLAGCRRCAQYCCCLLTLLLEVWVVVADDIISQHPHQPNLILAPAAGRQTRPGQY
jgi:hypothetical protein